MSFRFFFSYARANREQDGKLEQFFQDLRRRVARGLGIEEKQAGFCDLESMRTGTDWTKALPNALQTSSVLVCVVSPDLLRSEFCGKEFQVFLRRREEYQKSRLNKLEESNVILPTTWIPPRVPLPHVLSNLQYYDTGFAEEYSSRGLRYLMLKRDQSQYLEFLEEFASRIIDASENVQLPRLSTFPRFENVPNAFCESPTTRRGVHQPANISGGGPKNAKFLYVAASSDEFQTDGLRQNTRCYGEGGWFWRPFYPVEKRSIGEIIWPIVKGFRYQEVEWMNDITSYLKTVGENDEIVVMIVDAWTIRLERYGEILKECDREVLPNSSILVPWNPFDEETELNREHLRDAIQYTFRSKIQRNPLYFRHDIHSLSEFEVAIADILSGIKMDILNYKATKRRFESQALPSIPTPQGGQP